MDTTPPFSEQEKRFVLAEAIKKSSIPLDRLLGVLSDSNVQPAWPHMLLPHGRTLQSCIDAYESLIRSGQPSPYSNLPLPSPSNKRKSAPESLEHPMTAPSPKRRQSGVESLPSARDIRPKPTSSNGSPLPFASLPGPPATQPKKRGRPSKADVELRQAEAIARGEVLPPPKTLTPKVPKQPGSEESSATVFANIAPMAPAGPSADPGMGGQYQSEPGMGDTTGKKKRARAAPRQPKGPKNPGENMFSAVNPQIIQPQTREQQLPSPGLPSEPFQAIQPKEREPSVEAKEVAPNEPHPASQELQEPPKEPREEPKPAEPNPPPNA